MSYDNCNMPLCWNVEKRRKKRHIFNRFLKNKISKFRLWVIKLWVPTFNQILFGPLVVSSDWIMDLEWREWWLKPQSYVKVDSQLSKGKNLGIMEVKKHVWMNEWISLWWKIIIKKKLNLFHLDKVWKK
jgi:hypothetical protein